jgi:hypothetical protein
LDLVLLNIRLALKNVAALGELIASTVQSNIVRRATRGVAQVDDNALVEFLPKKPHCEEAVGLFNFALLDIGFCCLYHFLGGELVPRCVCNMLQYPYEI